MSSSPNPSWHPAMMPKSIAELPQNTPEEVASTPEEDELEEGGTQPAAASEPATDSQAVEESGAVLPSQDTSEDLGTEATDNSRENGEPAAHTESSGPNDDAQPSEATASPKHLSRMSFARTVSHEVSWNDDDDAEWTLPRTDTDPFKSLPETNRTNSFPPVPPLEDGTSHGPDQPLSFTQAEDLVREIEREDDDENRVFPDAGSGAMPSGTGAQHMEDGCGPRQSVGGDLNGAPEQALDARFEEGVPLVQAAKQEETRRGSDEGGHDIFGENEAGEDDDFFSNVRGNTAGQQDEFQPPPMERKSTMDVLKSLDMRSSGPGFVPLEETAEEAEDVEEAAQPEQTEDPENPSQPKAEEADSLDAKWKEMFADDDDEDFLPDEEPTTQDVDAAAFLGSDDEGLLDDAEIEQAEPGKPSPTIPGSVPAPTTSAVNRQYPPHNQTPAAPMPTPNPYLPAAASSALPTPASPYFPAAAVQPPVATPASLPSFAPPAATPYGHGAIPPPQEKSKAQSFVDKSKGGYSSPYDLPMEVVKPKRRASAQTPRTPSAPHPPPAAIPPPPRSASFQSHPTPPSSASIPGMARPGSSHSSQGVPSAHKPPSESFFEELPVTTKPRPASRQSQKSVPSPTQPSPYGLPPQSVPPPVTSHPIPPPPGPSAPVASEAAIHNLVAPPRVNPYASLSSAPGPPPAAPTAASTRYSPVPPSAPPALGAVPAPVSNRYSPAPPASRQPSGGYGPANAPPAPPILPHQPRTSSPLAQFEISHERSRAHVPLNQAENGLPEKRSASSVYESRLQRVPSLPPTREVEEEETATTAQSPPGGAPQRPPTSPPESRYAPPPGGPSQTPPPSSVAGQPLLSPPKRAMSSHSPRAPQYDFAPPPRSQTQSPGALYGNRPPKPVDPIPRPSSVNGPTSPRATSYPAASIPPVPAPTAPSTTSSRPRGFTSSFDVIPPTDGRENDPLQRWRGTPLISWGVGGTIVTVFPKEVPRYGMSTSVPAVVRSPGEVKIQSIKDITPLEERLAKFPGPLKGKSKKKETIAWLTTGIEALERGLPNDPLLHPHLSHDDKRAVERVLLWKMLRLFVEHDGVLEGNKTVEKAVRDILTPGLEAPESGAPYMNGAATLGQSQPSALPVQPDAVSFATVEQIRHHLLRGECEKAVWTAVDQRLWGHALLLSNALAPNLYKQVAQEFVKKEVNVSGHNNESLATLYEVLSGNHEESVDELVPVHARAGLQLVAKDAASGPSKDAMEGLDKWRETLGLILSNRSADDARTINSLGVLLAGYGRAEAAHICFMFSRSHTVFGGLDDPNSHFVLVGSDHKRQADQFAKEIEPLLLSEVYEYGQSLAGGSNVPITNPHLAGYKLEHALALAEYGFGDKALEYCDAIAAAITSQTRRSPYHHPILENAVEDLLRRLKQAPKEGSNSWISKPSMNKVSDSMWSRFNKFVAGDDDSSGQGSSGEGETGPFARVAGGTPTISRSPSASNLETFGPAVPSYGVPAPVPNGPVAVSAPPTRAASRYAPPAAQPAGTSNRPFSSSSSAYAPRSSMERASSELNRGSFELPRRSMEMQAGHVATYSPGGTSSPTAAYTPYGAEYNSPQESPYNPATQPSGPLSAPPQIAGNPGGVSNEGSSDSASSAPATGNQAPEASGYQPPSYGYEPPSLTPYEPSGEDENKGAYGDGPGSGSYEPPSYQPYSYEPPSYEAPQPSNDSDESDEESKPKPKKKGIMNDDDDDDLPTPKPAEKTKEEKDRENAEMFRRAAEEDAKRAAEAKPAKKGWGFTSWFGGGGKKDAQQQESTPNKPIRAKLGEPNSFYYDPELKRWVNKNAGPEETAKKATPPPPKAAAPRSTSSSPAPPRPDTAAAGRASAPPTGPPRSVSLGPSSLSGSASASSSNTNLASGAGAQPTPPPPGPVSMLRSASNTSTASAPPRAGGGGTLSNSSSIDDLLGSAGPRKPGAKKPRKGARYVDVMNKS